MAWYSLYLWFQPWRKTYYTNYIEWYKKELHRIWFESLSEEDQQKYLQRQEELKRERQLALRRLLMMPAMVSSALQRETLNIYGNNIR